MSRVPPPGRLALGLFSLALALYGNLRVLVATHLWPSELLHAALGAVAAVALALWAWAQWNMSLEEVGLTVHALGRSTVVGLGVGAGMGLLASLFLTFPLVVHDPIIHSSPAYADLAMLVRRAVISLPLDTVLVEEVAFRGVLLAALLRRLAPRAAVLLDAGVFSAWHVAINYRTVAATNIAGEPVLLALGLLGAHAAVFAGGVAFAGLRLRYGSLAPCVAAHWGVNTVLLMAQFRGNR